MTRNPNRKVINFAPGPCALPYEVLEKAQGELLDYAGSGVSVMELSHRSALFSKIMHNAETRVRELLKVPDNYKVMFLQGGGNGQFAAVALNFMQRTESKTADYVVTGTWSHKAAEEAKKFGKVNLAFPKLAKFDRIPPVSEWNLTPNASYVFVCDNETINGVEHTTENLTEKLNGVPLVADMSSNIFTRPVDISRYGCIFAGAQKNYGPAGVVMAIVRDDLLNHEMPETPSIMSYRIQAAAGSLFATPPCFGVYMCGLVFDWLVAQGGIEQVAVVNGKKAALVYETIENSNGFYVSPVLKEYRSRMTIPFRIYDNGEPSEKLEKILVDMAVNERSFREVKGHRSVGGLRVGIFNAISYEEVEIFVAFLKEFQAKHTTPEKST